MSLSVALGNALSGLTANSRMAEVVSSNLANALTDGYARRNVELSAASMAGQGAGVRIDGVTREVDRNLLAERRGAESTLASRRTLATALRSLESDLGSTDQGTSLAARIQALEGALVSASTDPSSASRLDQVLDRLKGVTGALNDAARTVQTRRAEADADIASQVSDLNGSLGALARINSDIVAARTGGRDATALMDQRQVLLDKVAAIVPVREVERPGGAVALLTPQGATLLDGTRAATVGFTATPVVTAAMSLSSGGLSGLTLDGQPVGTNGLGALAGGTLGASFTLRDGTLPGISGKLDDLARDLVERFANATTDPTVGTGPGLLTDAGAAFDPTNSAGLPSRIAVNAAVDPSKGGAIWRLRDGVGAGVSGPAGESKQLGRWLEALDTSRPLSSGGRSGSAVTLAAGLSSDIGVQRLSAEQEESYANARWSALREAELATGVDTDQEMQSLLQIEKAYAANARVVSAVDSMMQTLLEI